MKRKSWHYKLAELGSPHMYVGNVNMCQYIRYILVTLGLILMLSSAIIGGTVWVVFGMYQLIGCLFGITQVTTAGVVLLFVLGIALFSTAVFGCVYVLGNLRGRLNGKIYEWSKPESNTLVSNIYKHYKEKICFNVEFED